MKFWINGHYGITNNKEIKYFEGHYVKEEDVNVIQKNAYKQEKR